MVGPAPDEHPDLVLAAVHALGDRLRMKLMAGMHAERLLIIAGRVHDPLDVASRLLPVFGAGPVVAGPLAADVTEAAAVTQAALSGLRAVPAWPGAPRPVQADALLPERAVAGDETARMLLVEDVYRPLAEAGDVLMETVAVFLDTGGALEATARALFVHANTVRYRLRRAADVCGQAPTDARGALTLRLALMLGRLDNVI